MRAALGHDEDQRTEGFADAMRYDISAVNRRNHRTSETDTTQYGKQRSNARRDRAHEQGDRQSRHEPVQVAMTHSSPA